MEIIRRGAGIEISDGFLAPYADVAIAMARVGSVGRVEWGRLGDATAKPTGTSGNPTENGSGAKWT